MPISLPAVAKRLGHSNPTTTSKIYSHAIRSADEAAAEVLQDILAPHVKPKAKTSINKSGEELKIFAAFFIF